MGMSKEDVALRREQRTNLRHHIAYAQAMIWNCNDVLARKDVDDYGVAFVRYVDTLRSASVEIIPTLEAKIVELGGKI